MVDSECSSNQKIGRQIEFQHYISTVDKAIVSLQIDRRLMFIFSKSNDVMNQHSTKRKNYERSSSERELQNMRQNIERLLVVEMLVGSRKHKNGSGIGEKIQRRHKYCSG